MRSPLFGRPKCLLNCGLAVFAGFLCAAPRAAASRLWDWNYSGPAITATGTFTTSDKPNASGGYLITAITGARNGIAITGLQTTGTSIPGNQPYTVDNLVFTGPGPQLTSHGFGFSLADGTFSNPFYADFLQPPVYLEFFSNPSSGATTELTVQFSATPVVTPEPASYAFILLGVALVAFRPAMQSKACGALI